LILGFDYINEAPRTEYKNNKFGILMFSDNCQGDGCTNQQMALSVGDDSGGGGISEGDSSSGGGSGSAGVGGSGFVSAGAPGFCPPGQSQSSHRGGCVKTASIN
jgi:hypothetical protein